MKLITHYTLLILCCLLFISGMAKAGEVAKGHDDYQITNIEVMDSAVKSNIKPKTIDDIFIRLNARDLGSDEKVNSAELELISLDLQNADIVPIFRLLGEVSGRNIVIHPDVEGTISMRLLDVPWEQAMGIILRTFNLRKTVRDDVIRVTTSDAFKREKEAVDLETMVFTVNHANIDKIRETIEGANILSPRGSISVDLRTRSLVANDIASGIRGVQELIETLDKPIQQVMIEARMVEMTADSASEFGVQWGGQWHDHDRDFRMVGGLLDPVTGGRSPTLIDLGVDAATSAITMGYLNVAQTFGLDIRLSALETIGEAKIVSNPRIMTADNEEATIKQGRRIMIPIVVEGVMGVKEIDAALSLTVTPQIGDDDTVLLKIEVSNNTDVDGRHPYIPDITVREATTNVLLRDGETVVIGGILTTEEREMERGVSGLSEIPVLGWLFKREVKRVETEELLIFITPRIVRQ